MSVKLYNVVLSRTAGEKTEQPSQYAVTMQ